MSVHNYISNYCSVEIDPSAIRAAERGDKSHLYFEGSKHNGRLYYKIKSSEGLSVPLAVRNFFRFLMGREQLLYGREAEAVLNKASKKLRMGRCDSTGNILALDRNVQDFTGYFKMGDQSPLAIRRQKLLRIVRKINMINEGVNAARAKGLRPKSIQVEYVPEFFSGCYIGKELEHAKRLWQGTDGTIPFEKWLLAHPELHPQGKVEYLDENKRRACQVGIQNGRVLLKGKPYDTRNASTFHSGQGFAIFVLSLDNKLYVHSHVRGQFHHSSFLSGRPVLAAGELQTNREGRIVKLTNKSGHYNPSRAQNLKMLRVMQASGVDLKRVVYEEILPGGVVFTYGSAQDYLDKKGFAIPSTIRHGKMISANLCFDKRVGKHVLYTTIERISSPAEIDQRIYKLLQQLQGRVDFNQLQIAVKGYSTRVQNCVEYYNQLQRRFF